MLLHEMYYYEEMLFNANIIKICNMNDKIVAMIETYNFDTKQDALKFASFMVRSMNMNIK